MVANKLLLQVFGETPASTGGKGLLIVQPLQFFSLAMSGYENEKRLESTRVGQNHLLYLPTPFLSQDSSFEAVSSSLDAFSVADAISAFS